MRLRDGKLQLPSFLHSLPHAHPFHPAKARKKDPNNSCRCPSLQPQRTAHRIRLSLRPPTCPCPTLRLPMPLLCLSYALPSVRPFIGKQELTSIFVVIVDAVQRVSRGGALCRGQGTSAAFPSSMTPPAPPSPSERPGGGGGKRVEEEEEGAEGWRDR